MDLRSRLRQLADALPPAGAVTLTRADLVSLLEEEGATLPAEGGLDLTVDQVAEKLGRKPSTVRNWLGEGRLPGAYRFRGREWRIPPAELQAFMGREAAGEPRERGPVLARKPADTGEWRKHLRPAG